MTVLRGAIARAADRTLAWLMPPLALRWRRPRPLAAPAPRPRRLAGAPVTHAATFVTRHIHQHATFPRTTLFRLAACPGAGHGRPVAAARMAVREVIRQDGHPHAPAPWRPRRGDAGASAAVAGSLRSRLPLVTSRGSRRSAQSGGAAVLTRRPGIAVETRWLRSAGMAASAASRDAMGSEGSMPRRPARFIAGVPALQRRRAPAASGRAVDEQGVAVAPMRVRTAARRAVRHEATVDAAPEVRRIARAGVPLVWRSAASAKPGAAGPAVGAQVATIDAGPQAGAVAGEARPGEAATQPIVPERRPAALALGAADIDRLAEDVMRRIERRARIERERYGR